ncbi:MAG: 2-amino-4-hydroxy-6-hydroxymethyldihydropteridine pyrophosphokinase, partial [Firmicutes bacterium]|nr:2-amino-4-hydroxy-6-hydroxymethyldihydropteridine pyrophosphokinase [Bacillota bacterium]
MTALILAETPFDRIFLKGLCFSTVIGVFAQEKLQPQPVELDVVLQTLPLLACKTDNLDQTISYADVFEQVREVVETSRFELVERLAGHVAEKLLRTHASLMTVEIEVRKPKAPIEGIFQSAGIAITRCRADYDLFSTAYLSLGANLGDRLETLQAAVQLLGGHPQVRLPRISSVYETTPVGLLDQPDFLNLAMRIETTLDPFQLLKLCQQIEARFQRERRVHWGPRTLDIDLLTYGQLAT